MDFIKKTEGALKGIDSKFLAAPFEVDPNDNCKKCVLVMGLNPARGSRELNPAAERKCNLYFYSVGGAKRPTNFWYNAYFEVIYDLVNDVLNNNAKWPWCCLSWDIVEKQIKSEETLLPEIDAIKKQHKICRQRDVTIYASDMISYHETNSKNVIKNVDENKMHEYCLDVLKEHIKMLKTDAKKEILFVYINNAKVSHWLCKDEKVSVKEIDGVPVFFGSMLSGQRAMDVFSRKRLEEQIANYINK